MESSRRTLPAFLLAILMHGFLLGVLVIGFEWIPSRSAPPTSHSSQLVQAKVVDRDKVLAEIEQRQQVERKSLASTPHQPPIAPEQQAEPEPQQSMESRRRQQELAQLKQEAERKAEEKAQEQARLKQEAERKAKEQARRQAEAEKKRKQAEEEKRRAEAKKKERLEEEKRQAEAAAKREAAEKQKKAKAAARRKAEEERHQRELQASIEAEQNAEQAKAAIARFIPQLQMRVRRYWIRPSAARDNLVVLLRVEMSPNGNVRSATVVESSGNRNFDRSAQAAVYRAAPLPIPTNPAAAAKLQSFNFKFCPGSSC